MCVRSCGTCRRNTGSGRPWRHVAAELEQAAAGADMVDVAIALRLALMLENVECRPK